MPASRIRFHRLAAHEYRLARDWYWERSEEAASSSFLRLIALRTESSRMPNPCLY